MGVDRKTAIINILSEFNVPAPILQALHHLNPHNTSNSTHIPCDLLQPLFQLGITSLSDLVGQDGTHVIDGHALKRSPWGRLAGAKHIVALNRLARLLNEGPGRDNDIPSILRHRDSTPDLPRAHRKIHPGNIHITSVAISPIMDETTAPITNQSLITDFLPKEGRPTSVIQQPQETDPAPGSPSEPVRARYAYMRAPTLHRDKRPRDSQATP